MLCEVAGDKGMDGFSFFHSDVCKIGEWVCLCMSGE